MNDIKTADSPYVLSASVTGRQGAERLVAQPGAYRKKKGICENNCGAEYGTM